MPKLPAIGSVHQACEILDGCDRSTIYALIALGAVSANTRRPDRPNSHYQVDLQSVWNHRQGQIQQPHYPSPAPGPDGN